MPQLIQLFRKPPVLHRGVHATAGHRCAAGVLTAVLLSVRLLIGFASDAGCAEDGLILHLSFDDQAAIGHDGSGCGNHGVPHGSPAWGEAAVRGGALRLDGVDDYIDCGNAESLQSALANRQSIS